MDGSRSSQLPPHYTYEMSDDEHPHFEIPSDQNFDVEYNRVRSNGKEHGDIGRHDGKEYEYGEQGYKDSRLHQHNPDTTFERAHFDFHRGNENAMQRGVSHSSSEQPYLNASTSRDASDSSRGPGYTNKAFRGDAYETNSTVPSQSGTSLNAEKLFTVEHIEEDPHLRKWHRQSSKLLSGFKFLLSFVLACLTLACVVFSKISIVSIVSRLAETKYEYNSTFFKPLNCVDTTEIELCSRESSFLMLCLVLMFPPAYTLVKLYLLTCRKTAHPWPTKLAIVWICVGTILEVIGLTLFFVGVVVNVYETDIILILMNALFIFPVVFQFIKESTALSSDKQMNLPAHLYAKRRRRHVQNIVLAGVAFVFQLCGLCGIVYLLWKQSQDKPKLFLIPLSIACISLAWSPKVRKLQIDHDLAYVWSDVYEEGCNKIKLPRNHRVKYLRTHDINDDSSEHSKIRQKHQSIKDDAKNIIVQTNTSRGKSTLITSLLKLFFIPIFVTFFVYIFDVADITKVYEGFVGLTHNRELLFMVLVQILSSFIGYHTSWIGCTVTLQKLCFAIPLTLSTPICIGIVISQKCVLLGITNCRNHVYGSYGPLVAAFSVVLWLGQFFATTYYAWKSQEFIMADEAMLFWVPTYDGSLLEQNLLLNRKNEATNEFFVNYRSLVKKSSVYICTTMYHENDYEMEQLLYSIASIDRARRSGGRIFEAHIWFDDGVRDSTLKVFAIQLMSLLSHTVHVLPGDAVKLNTPYGMELKWILPGGIPFHVHLKDNFKVKNKKRWSQVMYMSYVLDYRDKGDHDNSFILTTDADVKFRPEDVTALMDFMSRDPSVGAVCGRTHPMGSGPLVWYQIFDYAIGHWLLKVAEHVLGSVLCSPGCFSVYRCCALQDILPMYATSVECAMDFLTKDMGEDRWLCTLMIERGWRLDYCASSTDSTYCPDTFDEFFKQRRRWGPSTLANQVVLIQNQRKIRETNDDINLVFVAYQVLMMVSTIIGPGTVLLIVSSGMHAAYPSHFNLSTMFLLNLCVAVGYVLICLYCSQRLQLIAAKLLTFVYSIVMTITVVGLMVQIADDLDKQRTQGYQYYLQNTTDTYIIPKDQSVSELKTRNETVIAEFVWQFTPPTIFLFFLIGLFVMTAILHGFEGFQLLHGLWYLLCLPSGYIFLMIYSLVNITDRSWGTRETVVRKTSDDDSMHWYHRIWFKFRQVFFCCFKDGRSNHLPGFKKKRKSKEDKIDIKTSLTRRYSKRVVRSEERQSLLNPEGDEEIPLEAIQSERPSTWSAEGASLDERRQVRFTKPHNNTSDSPGQRRPCDIPGQGNYYIAKQDLIRAWGSEIDHLDPQLTDASTPNVCLQPGHEGYTHNNGVYMGETYSDISDFYIAMNIEDWLDGPYAKYTKMFTDAGYDDTTFIMGMKEQELIDIGISNRGHRKRILAEIERLPPEEIDQDVPDDVQDWLILLGLHEYWPLFDTNSYAEPNALADLKLMDRATLSSTFNITKVGHLNKLEKAVKQLKYPTSGQRKSRQSKLALERVPLLQLSMESPEEFVFWDRLRKICLTTEQGAFSQSEELHSKLFELRNSALVVFAVCNILWLSIMMAILNQGKKLTILKSSFLSVGFLVVYALLMLMQFAALLVHRISTWLHFVARTPFKPGDSPNKMWSFLDDDLPSEPSRDDIEEVREIIGFNMQRRSQRRTIEARERAEHYRNWASAY